MESSPAYNKLKHVVTDENMFNDLTYLTKFCHSGDLNLFHSLYNLNCLKELYFFAMVCMYALSRQLETTIQALKESNRQPIMET